MKVIALSGWKRSGKDTVAEYLVKDKGFVRLGFADVLKDMVSEQYNIPREWCDDPEFKEKPIKYMPVDSEDDFAEMIHSFMHKELNSGYWTPRTLCILEGSVKRAARSDYWTKKVIDKIFSIDSNKQLDNTEALVVISDLRFQSEIKQLKQAFGEDLITLRINRFDEPSSNDPTERDLDKYEFDKIVENKSTIINLIKNVDNILEGLCL